jgi:DNA-binding NarL/FixJ family response regulator
MAGRHGQPCHDPPSAIAAGVGEPDPEVIGEASDGPEAVELVRTRELAVVLMDIRAS